MKLDLTVGGHIEPNETPDAAIAREFKEDEIKSCNWFTKRI